MAPCHIPEYRSPEYERAFDELWALACRGRVSVAQVRREMLRLHQEFVMAPVPAPRRRPDVADERGRPGAGALSSALAVPGP